MTFKQYIKYNKETTKSLFKISLGIFTLVFVIMAILISYKTQSFMESVDIFTASVLSGLLLTVFIFLLAIYTSYIEVKANIKFYNTIPTTIREKFEIILAEIRLNPKFYYLQLEVVSTNKQLPIYFQYNKGNKEVWITITNKLNPEINIQKQILKFNKKYKKKGVSLTGIGLRKTIKNREWLNITDKEIEIKINELIDISNWENMEILKWPE